MSLLRSAEKSFANQQVYKALNAFVCPRDEGNWIHEHTWNLREAAKRRDGGTSMEESFGRV